MKKRNVSLKRYYQQIKSCLSCPGRQKRKIMQNIRCAVEAFLTDTPDADMAAVIQRFGTPEQIAGSCIDEMGTGELRKELNIRKKIVTVIATAAVAALLIWCVAVVIASIREWVIPSGYYEVIVNEGPSYTIDEGE